MQNKILLVALLLLGGCSSYVCDEKSKEVKFAKALSKQKLEYIYKETREFFADKERMHYDGPIPQQFTELGVKAIRVHKGIHLRLKGCFDHWVDIVVFDNLTNPKIELWHSGTVKELLWEQKK